ncbi:uncharacterized protein VTP21DRAFT_1051 [Calcarisporiella thermophila]|uniref:uncharacterized protein n=1 Tax=Calcarisporiella thermophila TaxID=911321 RepID=UPI003743D3C7
MLSKTTFLFCVVVFLVASALCRAIKSMVALIMFRAIQGIGGGGLFGLALIILSGNQDILRCAHSIIHFFPYSLFLSDIITPEELSKYQGLLGAAFTVASIIGPLLGGVFTDKLSWRWCFYVNLPIGIVAILMIILVLRLPAPTGSLTSKLKRIDIMGLVVIIALTVCLLLGISFGGNEFQWNSPVVIALFVAGLSLFGVFYLIESKLAAEPVLSLRLFRDADFAILSVVNFFGLEFFMGFFYYSFYFQLLGASATHSGLRFLPMSLVLIVVNITSMTTTWNETTTVATQIGYTVIVGLGIGFEIQNSVLAMQIAVEPKDIAVATSSGMFFRTLGLSFGIAVGGALLNNLLASHLVGIPGLSIESVKNDLAYITRLHPKLQGLVFKAYINALQWVFSGGLIAWSISGGLTLLIRSRPLSKKVVQAPMEM